MACVIEYLSAKLLRIVTHVWALFSPSPSPLDVRKQFSGGMCKKALCLFDLVTILWVCYTRAKGSKYRNTLSQKVLSRSFCPIPSLSEGREEPCQGSHSQSGLLRMLPTPWKRAQPCLSVKQLRPDSWFFLQAVASCSCFSVKI